MHITPRISKNSLLSTSKYEDAGYITEFEKDKVNVHDATNTMITSVTRGSAQRVERKR